MCYRTMLFVLLSAGMTSVSAVDMASVKMLDANDKAMYQNDVSYFHKILALSLGNAWVKSGRSQSVSFPAFDNYYTVNNTYRSALMGGLFLGIEYWKNPLLALQLGLSGYAYSSVSVSGSVLQSGLPQLTNFNYNYNLRSQRLVAESKVLSTLQNRFHPYVSGNLGVAANKAYSYQETPLALPNFSQSSFANNNTSSFTYGLGAGIDMDLNQFFRLGVGYQYANLGNFLLGLSRAQATNDALNAKTLGSHEFRFQLTAVG